MKQFILKEKPDRDGIVKLSGNDYKYLVRVRRLATGELFPALLPDGEEKVIRVVSINKGVLTGKCETASVSAPCTLPPAPCLILFQALPKGNKMDLIVRQAAETGVTEIVPFISEFSYANKKNAEAHRQKHLRWERIVKEARQQSGSKIPTAIHETLLLEDLFTYWKKINAASLSAAYGLLFHHERLENNSLFEYLNNIDTSSQAKVAVVIGPEGGFSDKEVSLFIENNFKPFTIGDTVLRCETAALVCTAAIKIILTEKIRGSRDYLKKTAD